MGINLSSKLKALHPRSFGPSGTPTSCAIIFFANVCSIAASAGRTVITLDIIPITFLRCLVLPALHWCHVLGVVRRGDSGVLGLNFVPMFGPCWPRSRKSRVLGFSGGAVSAGLLLLVLVNVIFGKQTKIHDFSK
jgi:hypothetical protein